MHFQLTPASVYLLLISLFALSCGKSAETPQQAADILTSVTNWKIEEIAVNDAVTFKDGKMTQQFGGIDFERYMEVVQIKKDGTFSGVFKGETEPFLLQWKVEGKSITIGAPDSSKQAGGWTVLPGDVSQESFVMKTQSTAYDFPRLTKISLKFKAAQ
nr:hypothetical protein [uncultured Dyadobacter sp.]